LEKKNIAHFWAAATDPAELNKFSVGGLCGAQGRQARGFFAILFGRWDAMLTTGIDNPGRMWFPSRPTIRPLSLAPESLPAH